VLGATDIVVGSENSYCWEGTGVAPAYPLGNRRREGRKGVGKWTVGVWREGRMTMENCVWGGGVIRAAFGPKFCSRYLGGLNDKHAVQRGFWYQLMSICCA